MLKFELTNFIKDIHFNVEVPKECMGKGLNNIVRNNLLIKITVHSTHLSNIAAARKAQGTN